MKRFIYPLIISLLCIGFTACSEEEEPYPTYPNPAWAYAENTNHTASMTIIATLPEAERLYEASDDELAAFIGGECRGVATRIGNAYYIMVKGAASDVDAVTVKYYSASRKYLYEAVNWCAFEPDATYGTVDEPEVLPLTVVTH